MIWFQMKLYNELGNWLQRGSKQGSNVGMKDIILFHGKWEKIYPFSFTNSLNIIDSCANEGNGDDNETVDDGGHMNYESHESTSKR